MNDAIECTEEEKQSRLDNCKTCTHFKIESDSTLCEKCGCKINYLITFNFKECPIGKW